MGVCSHTFTYHAPPLPPPLRPARYELLSRPPPCLSPSFPALSCLSALLRPPSCPPSAPRRLRHPCSVSAGRFFAVGTISLCQTGAGLICEAFAGTSRPRIIIKIPHRRPDLPRCPPPAPPPPGALAARPLRSPCSAAPTFRDITFHSELDQSFNGRKFNLCAATK